MRTPCLGCPKVGCGSYHDECKEYIQYRLNKNKENLARSKEYEATHGTFVNNHTYSSRVGTSPFKCHKK